VKDRRQREHRRSRVLRQGKLARMEATSSRRGGAMTPYESGARRRRRPDGRTLIDAVLADRELELCAAFDLARACMAP